MRPATTSTTAQATGQSGASPAASPSPTPPADPGEVGMGDDGEESDVDIVPEDEFYGKCNEVSTLQDTADMGLTCRTRGFNGVRTQEVIQSGDPINPAHEGRAGRLTKDAVRRHSPALLRHQIHYRC